MANRLISSQEVSDILQQCFEEAFKEYSHKEREHIAIEIANAHLAASKAAYELSNV